MNIRKLRKVDTMIEWTKKYKVMVQPGDEIIETISAYEAEGYLRMLELRLAEKDKELKDAGVLINNLTTTTERQTKEIERLTGESATQSHIIEDNLGQIERQEHMLRRLEKYIMDKLGASLVDILKE
jgi:hypothetical protein